MSYRWQDYEFVIDGVWHGEIVDNDGFVIAEVWDNGDGGGNFYVWQDAVQRREIEDEASGDLDGWVDRLRDQAIEEN